MTAVHLVLLCFAAVLAIIGTAVSLTMFLSVFLAAPYVPSDRERVKAMIDLAELKPGERVADLGSGDGRIVAAAASAGAIAEGYEANPLAALQSRIALRSLGLAGRTRIIQGSYRGRDLRHLDAVFCYLLPEEMIRLKKWLPEAMKPGARIVVGSFPFPDWTPEESRGSVYRYRIPYPNA